MNQVIYIIKIMANFKIKLIFQDHLLNHYFLYLIN